MTPTTATNSTRRHASMNVLDHPYVVMGIVNATPDSFYDGGRHAGVDAAVRHGCALAADGAAVLDVGGESTRPGAAEVSVEEECNRVLPVIQKLVHETGVVVSVDTRKSEVARRALDCGASWVNDVSAGRADPLMAPLVAKAGCPVVLMHSRKTPGDMQTDPWYSKVTLEVISELRQSVALFTSASVDEANILLDPGIGFAKRFKDNIILLRELDALVRLGFPVVIGTSRKSFIGRITGKKADGRLVGSLASVGIAWQRGAQIFRVHDVAETVDFLKVHCTIAMGVQ